MKEKIAAKEALALINAGKSIDSYKVMVTESMDAMNAFHLRKNGVDVPDDLITYDDADIAYDPEFDDYEWERTDLDPLNDLKEKLTVSIEINEDIKEWIQKNGIEVNHLLEELLQNFYSTYQLINGK